MRINIRQALLTLLLSCSLGASNGRAEDTEPTPAANPAASAESRTNDGDRDWGRDDGIAVGLSPASKIIVGVGFLVIVSLVGWMVFHQKPDGTVHPYDEG